MAAIFPFSAIRPNPASAGQLVFAKPQAESVAGDMDKPGGLRPLKDLLETPARLRPETEDGQAKAYREIAETLDNLLLNEHVWQIQIPGIYVYQVYHNGISQTGIWALIDVNDYKRGHIKTHELTLADSVRRMTNYRSYTGLEGSPVLLTYEGKAEIDQLIDTVTQKQPHAVYGNAEGVHKLWHISDEHLINDLQTMFKAVPVVYLADGHHRLEAASKLMAKNGIANSSLGKISALFMAADKLVIEPYHRVVIPDEQYDSHQLMARLEKDFFITESADHKPILPVYAHNIGVGIDNNWFLLKAKKHTYHTYTDAEKLDAALLQRHILQPLFDIKNPQTDRRLICVGGHKALAEINQILKNNPKAIAFTLPALTVADIVSAAEGGYILPPKSTWVVPKIPYGLLIQKH